MGSAGAGKERIEIEDLGSNGLLTYWPGRDKGQSAEFVPQASTGFAFSGRLLRRHSLEHPREPARPHDRGWLRPRVSLPRRERELRRGRRRVADPSPPFRNPPASLRVYGSDRQPLPKGYRFRDFAAGEPRRADSSAECRTRRNAPLPLPWRQSWQCTEPRRASVSLMPSPQVTQQ